jgi:MFS family permease
VPTVLSYAATHTRTSAGETAGASLIGGYFGALLVPLLAGALTSLVSLRVGVGLVVVMGILTVICGFLLKRDADHRGSTGVPGYAP